MPWTVWFVVLSLLFLTLEIVFYNSHVLESGKRKNEWRIQYRRLECPANFRSSVNTLPSAFRRERSLFKGEKSTEKEEKSSEWLKNCQRYFFNGTRVM
jgi:hypothetical protein